MDTNIKKCTITSNINNNENTILIKIDNKHTTIDKVKCRDYYWHLMKHKYYTPRTTQKWSITYLDFYIYILTMPKKEYGQEFLNYPLNAVERPRYKVFNIELFIELSPATYG